MIIRHLFAEIFRLAALPASACRRASRRARSVERTVLVALAMLGAAAVHAAETSVPVLQPGTMAARVAACTGCHGAQGSRGPDSYYPRLAGKPEAYLYHQLLSFRDGSRTYRPMTHLLAGLPDDYLKEIAAYFAAQHVPYPPTARTNIPADLLQQGKILVQAGDASRNLPACVQCHGQGLAGVAPAIPGLLGLPRDYVTSQFGSWRSGLRRAREPDCMGDIAKKMTAEDIAAVSAWLSSQPVPESYAPAITAGAQLPLQCGSQPETGDAK